MSKAKVVKTLYWEERDARFMFIVWDGNRARHHKLPKTILSETEARKYVKANALGMAAA